MSRVARQETSVSATTPANPTTTESTGIAAPSVTATETPGSSDAVASTSSSEDTANTAATFSASTDTNSNTAAATTTETTAPSTSPTTVQASTSDGASETSVLPTSADPSHSTQTGATGSTTVQSGSTTDSHPASTTGSTSASLTGTSSTVTSLTSATSSSTSSIPSSTTESSSSSQSSSSTSSAESTSTTSFTESSSSRTSTGTPSTSLTTSFTEIVSTINGQVTTIVSPVATLGTDRTETVSKTNGTAIIAGGTVAGVVVVIACLLAIFLCRRHQRRKLTHRYLPTPRSVALSGEDDFDLAGSRHPQRGFVHFGTHRNIDSMEGYRDVGSDSGRGANSPAMRELPNEPPPRLLRPVASKTGSYFQESVWPPPEDGSRLSDPLMAASNVDLHSIVDEVMGSSSSGQPGRPSEEAPSITSPTKPSRLRGGAMESSSFSSEPGTLADFRPRSPLRHGESPTMSSVESGRGESPQHLRDWSTDSAVGLLANMDGSSSSRSARRVSGGSGGAWLPPGAAPPSAYHRPYGRPTSPPSPLRVVTEPQQTRSSSSSRARARGKASEAAQERRGSLAVANPSPRPDDDNENDIEDKDNNQNEYMSSSAHAQSFPVSPTSTQLHHRRGGTLEAMGEEPYPDESPVDRRSIPSMLTRAWLVDIGDDEDAITPVSVHGQGPREELPPRYDMIRRDSDEGEDVQTRTITS